MHDDAIHWLIEHIKNDEEMLAIVEDIRLNHSRAGQTMRVMKEWCTVVEFLNNLVTLEDVKDLVEPPWEDEEEKTEGRLYAII